MHEADPIRVSRPPLLVLAVLGVAAALGLFLIFRPPAGPSAPIRIGCTECPDEPGKNYNPMASFANEVIATAAARRGIAVRWTRFDGPVERALQEGRIDLYPRHVAERPIPRGIYYTAPWLEMNYALLARRDAAVTTPAPNRLRTQGLRVAFVDSPFLREVIQDHAPGAIPVPVRGRRALVEAVCAGQAGASLLESRVAQSLVMTLGRDCPDADLELTPLPGAIMPAAIVARVERTASADTIRDEIVRMAEDGALQQIHGKWFFIVTNETRAIDEALAARQAAWMWTCIALMAAVFGLIMVIQKRRLRHAQRAAAAANATKSRFLASMSHEIRTPMNGVLGLTNMLLDTPLDARQREIAGLVRHSAESLLHIINDVLDLSKIEAGKLSLENTRFALPQLAGDTCAMLRPGAEAKGLSLAIEIHPDVPETFNADKGRLVQILLNLTANAIKFTDAGGVTLRIRPDSIPGSFRFAVQDTGIGISPEALPRLFTEFEQSDPSIAARYGGTGLGLAISKRLVSLMGGLIGVESAAGKGSTFWFTVPLETAALECEEDEVPPLGPSLRVLLCEDNAVNQRVAVYNLQRLGHAVTVAGNGQEALDAARRDSYDLILMDCQMPVMDGFEATRRLRLDPSGNRDTPIIALTAAVLPEDRDRCREAGMEEILAKPLQRDALARTLARYQSRSPGFSGVKPGDG